MRMHVVHTHELDVALLADVRRLLVDVFGPSRGRSEDDFSEHDWQHALGGVHVIAFDGDDVIGHASVVQRQMITGRRTRRVGYVEGVGVRADRQRGGIGGQMMAVLEPVIERAFDFGALSASDAAVPMYTARGWALWHGPLSAMTPAGVHPTPEEEGGVYVWNIRGQNIDISAELTCDWRAGDLW
jgi:aminoglycoside 2'-N-acetyltransferase I